MSGVNPGLEPRPVFAPIAAPVRRLERGPYRCGCNATYGGSCRYCDGTSADEWEIDKAARTADRERARLMRTPAYRQRWLATFAEPLRPVMAAAADRQFGPLPTTTDHRPRRAS